MHGVSVPESHGYATRCPSMPHAPEVGRGSFSRGQRQGPSPDKYGNGGRAETAAVVYSTGKSEPRRPHTRL